VWVTAVAGTAKVSDLKNDANLIAAIRSIDGVNTIAVAGLTKDTDVTAAVTGAQLLVDRLKDDHIYIDAILLEGVGDYISGAISTWTDLRPLTSPNVSVLIGRDTKVATSNAAFAKHAAVGSALGMLLVRAVHENLGSVDIETKPSASRGQPMSDADFIKEYGTKARNLGFHSLASTAVPTMRNTLKVVVDRTTVLKEGDNVVLRLLESAKVGGLHILRQSRLIAVAKIEGNRMHLLVKSIEVDGHIIAVKLSAYDTDGQEGVYIPGSEDINALKEVGAYIGGSMGTSFTFASSAKDQIISEAARGVMQGASQLLQKKLRTIKVTLKGGYRLFLVQSK